MSFAGACRLACTRLNKSIRASCRLYSNTAIVCDIPASFVEAVRLDGGLTVDLTCARQQHENYVTTLKQCGLDVVRLDADEKFPDCLFVEDVAVVIEGRALITRPGHPSRRGEVEAMRKTLLSLKHPPEIVEMDDQGSFIDGGDVIFTGKEIFVGLTSRTNEKGIQCLARTFPDFQVTSYPLSALHLKSIMSMCGTNTVAVGADPQAREIMEKMKSFAKYKYKYVQFDNDVAANMLAVNEFVLVKPREEIGHDNYQIVKNNVKGEIIEVPFSEMYKTDGCLTCCSILLHQPA